MSVQHQSLPPKEADLETTAELPVLDVAAYEAAAHERSGSTDTWHLPALSNAAAIAAAASSATANVPVVADERSAQLENDLRSLSENLRDVEERLTRKGERLLELERELAAARAERVAAEARAAGLLDAAEERAASLAGAAEERAASLIAELGQVRTELSAEQALTSGLQSTIEVRESAARAQASLDQELVTQLTARDQQLSVAQRDLRDIEARAAHYLETLHTLEGRRVIFDGQLLGLESRVDARDVRVAALERDLGTQTGRARDLGTELSERKQRVQVLEREVNALAASLAQRNVEFEQSERAKAKLQESVASLTETLTARVDRIRALEAAATNQNQSFGERLQEIESVNRQRDALKSKVGVLETALSDANADLAQKHSEMRAAAESRAELEKRFGASQQGVELLDRELTIARAEIAERVAAALRLEAERDEQINRFAASEARAVELERRGDDQAENIRQLQEELRISLGRSTELEGDLRAAEDALNRLETELRTKSTRLDDLARTHEEWRSTIESARQSLAERESLIHRLETEAANSAALLGNIQQSIKRLDPAAQSGSHEIAPEGAVRLLIRSDGDTEVVHVLGRKTTVGRTPDNDLQIDAKFISRNHAVILAGPNHTIIEDLNSTNGVAVNGRRITRHTLRDGDNLAIGKTSFRFAVRPTIERRQ
jgi:chromosome segregation ATPase